MDTEGYLRWFAKLGLFYQILIAGSVLAGMVALITSLALRNPFFLFIAVFWFLVAPASISFASARE
jgi:hypothetical protein